MTSSSEIKKGPTVSIVIPARNEAECIGQCLGAIRGMRTSVAGVEIVVVDNNSTDRTADISRTYGATVVTKKEGTIGSLRNAGAKVSKGDFIAFLDADCIVPPDWIEKALVILAGDRKSVAGFRMTIPSDANWVARSWDSLFSKRDITAEVEWLPSGNMIMAREAFLLTGGFDEKLETNEDCDLCFRLRKLGFRMLSCADTAVVHLRPPATLGQVFRKELWHGKEVLNVFINDIYQTGNANIFRRKNFRVILYGFCYLLFILFILLALIVVFSVKVFWPLVVAILFPILVSLTLAIRYARFTKRPDLVSGLTILLMTYGFSRAISLLPYNRVRGWLLKT